MRSHALDAMQKLFSTDTDTRYVYATVVTRKHGKSLPSGSLSQPGDLPDEPGLGEN